MPIFLYPKCWRGRDDCQPIHCIDGVSQELTDEQMAELSYTPDSFVCSGIVDPSSRTIEQDCYRLCFKNAVVDEMSDNDIQDLAHTASVLTAALALHAAREINSGYTLVPTVNMLDQGEHQ